jgi:hypothetical protein
MGADPHPSEILGAGVIAAAVEYVKLRDSLNAHSSPEGKKLNASVKAYLRSIQSR